MNFFLPLKNIEQIYIIFFTETIFEKKILIHHTKLYSTFYSCLAVYKLNNDIIPTI